MTILASMSAQQCATIRAAAPHLYSPSPWAEGGPDARNGGFGDGPSPFSQWGFETGAGWYDTVLEASTKLEAAITAMPEHERVDFRVTQVKQKLGQLEIYLSKYNGALLDIITASAARASVTCETCGKPGSRRTLRGYIFVACTLHMGTP